MKRRLSTLKRTLSPCDIGWPLPGGCQSASNPFDSERRADVCLDEPYVHGMEIEFNQDALTALGEEIAKSAEVPLNRGIQLAKGQPLEVAVQTVAGELANAGLEPNVDGLRQQLIDLGWKA